MAMKETTKTVWQYLKDHADEKLTAEDIANATGVDKKAVNGAFTRAIQIKGFGVREEAEIELADGTHKAVKFLRLTPDGIAFDLDAPQE